MITMIIFLVLPSSFLYKADWVFMLISILLLIILFIPEIVHSTMSHEEYH